jgi:hypothetical protein
MRSKNISRETLLKDQLVSLIFWEGKMLLQGMNRLNLMDSMMLYKEAVVVNTTWESLEVS